MNWDEQMDSVVTICPPSGEKNSVYKAAEYVPFLSSLNLLKPLRTKLTLPWFSTSTSKILC